MYRAVMSVTHLFLLMVLSMRFLSFPRLREDSSITEFTDV
jgi:hypothetical protein